MKIPTAKERRKKTYREQEVKQDTLRKKAKIFLETVIAEAINDAEGTCVNEQLPSEAYGEGRIKFIQYCKDVLEPLGYTADESHDGGGMYTTLCVSWDKA